MIKQLVILSIFSLVHASSGIDALWIDEEDPIEINSFTLKVQQRYYYLARLEPIHELLQYIHDEPEIKSCFDFNISFLLQPTHPHIVNCITQLQTTKSFEPLFNLWQELKSYKYIDEHECLVEYTALVCVIAQNIVHHLEQEYVDHIGKAVAFIECASRSGDQIVYSHDIAYRYYILKRLKNVTKLLKHCSQRSYHYIISSSVPEWSNPQIAKCIESIEQTNSLNPLIELLKDLEQYAYINDIVFMHELLELIVFVEQHALAPLYLPKKRELCAHYEHAIEGLTIEELLQSIDILTSHIDPYAFDVLDKQITIPQVQSFGTLICAGLIAWYASQKWGV